MNYAVVEVGGKQYKVKVGDNVLVDSLSSENDSLTLDKVLLHVDEGKVEVGSPFVSGVVVKGKVVDQVRGEKIKVLRFQAKSRHRKRYGARAMFTKILIESIGSQNSKSKDVREK